MRELPLARVVEFLLVGVVVRGQGLGQGLGQRNDATTAAATADAGVTADAAIDDDDDDNDDDGGIIDESKEGLVLCELVTLLSEVVKMCRDTCPGACHFLVIPCAAFKKQKHT